MAPPKTSDKAAPKDVREDWTFEELQQEADEIRKKLNNFRTSLGRVFVQKQELIDLMVVAAVAQEPLLLIAPPGTAKSDLVLKFTDASVLAYATFFRSMPFSRRQHARIVSPMYMRKLRDGRYISREQRQLPPARLAFPDELFKSNSAIL